MNKEFLKRIRSIDNIFVTIDQAADLLEISIDEVRNLCLNKKLAYYPKEEKIALYSTERSQFNKLRIG